MTYIPIEQAVRMADAAERARQAVSTLRLCPVCLGRGEFDVPSNMGPGVPKCWVCKGGGFVDMSSVCSCGMPAILFKDDVLYCGRDLCLTTLKHKRTGFGC
jgi:hypothetical protein